jgi:lysyl-tRNA synthetase class 2
MNDKDPASAAPQDENQIIAERRAKLARLREQGQAFRTTSGAATSPATCIATTTRRRKRSWRLEARRVRRGPHAPQARHGQGVLRHAAGHERQIQIYVNNDVTGAEVHEAFKHWDLGDILGVEGTSSRPTRASSRSTRRSCACSRSRCARCRRNSTGSPTWSSATASATSTSS